MKGIRVAIFGLGRSGIASAKLCAQIGAIPTIYDEKPFSELKDSQPLAEAQALGFRIELGFSGFWDASSTDLIVTSPGVPMRHEKLLAAEEQGIPVVGEIELAYKASKAPILGITGTNGKSTTTVMAYLCLLAAGKRAVLCGNVFGSGYPEIPLTEAAANSDEGQVLVAEISSFQLEWTREFRPRAAIITNLSDDHLNRYRDFAEYSATKHRIFGMQGAGDTAVWNLSQPSCEPPRTEGVALRTFGELGADAYLVDRELNIVGERVALDDLPFAGSHNYDNAMAAVLLAAAVTDRSEVARLIGGLADFRGLKHRMERIGERDGVLLINNSMCTNPAAVVASSKSLNRAQHLLIGGADKEMDFAVLRTYLRESGHHAYLFGADSEEISRQLGGQFPVFSTMAEAFQAAVAQAKPSQAIMLAPGAASLDQFKDFRDRGDQFTELAEEWLNACKTV